MPEKPVRLGRRRALAPTKTTSFAAFVADVGAAEALAYERHESASAVYRDLLHAALVARLPLARAVAALRSARADADEVAYDAYGPLHGAATAPEDPAILGLLEVYGALVLGLPAVAVRAAPENDLQARLQHDADAEEAAERRVLVEAALRADLSLPPASTLDEALDDLAEAMLAAPPAGPLPWED